MSLLVGLTEKQIEELPDTIIGIKRTQNIQELVGIYTFKEKNELK